jgi:AcrR family transcriptional regulator
MVAMPRVKKANRLNRIEIASAEDGPLGQRERNKADKLRRIESAARELFVSKGFDETTTREIAIRASVGMGTVFIYAENKRDLLFLIANQDLEEVYQTARKKITQSASFMTNLMATFQTQYAYFLKQPELSRLMLREMVFYDSGQQASQFAATRKRTISLVCEIVDMAVKKGEIRSSDDHRIMGWIIFCVYQVELRRWLTEGKPKLKNGIMQLERALRTLIVGFHPKPSAMVVSVEPAQRRTNAGAGLTA